MNAIQRCKGIRAALKARWRPAPTLIAGPYVGEFGWELTEWQGYVRRLRQYYRKVIAISYPSSQYLYENCEFFPHQRPLKDSGFGFGTVTKKEVQRLLMDCARDRGLTKHDVFTPWHLNRISGKLLGGQAHKLFRESAPNGLAFDVAFHFRNFVRSDGTGKNYSAEHIDWLAGQCHRQGWRTCAIGMPGYAYCPPGSVDCRCPDLRTTVGVISGSQIVVGGSSGPMHLAALCAKPIVVWIGIPDMVIRYTHLWNPHRSPVYMVSGTTFQPPREDVWKHVIQAMQDVKAGQPPPATA